LKRLVWAVVLSSKELSYVEAARGLGASHLQIVARHILPQCVAPYLILATTHLGVAIIIEAALGFLGVGIPPPTPTWGNGVGLDDNNYANVPIKRSIGLSRSEVVGLECCHVWPNSCEPSSDRRADVRI
jgi:ABC-type microcin C transport system permease subunit YejE